MSTEEIIDAWKHNEDDSKKHPEGEQLRKEMQTPKGVKPAVGKVPSNPAGEQEVSDEDLKAVEGGMMGDFTCSGYSC
jgi:mersacidin/lichenicidin family type 2 lantibiotic